MPLLNIKAVCPPPHYPHPKPCPLQRHAQEGLAGRKSWSSCFELGVRGGFFIIYDLISVPEVNNPNRSWQGPELGLHSPPLDLEQRQNLRLLGTLEVIATDG